MKQANVYLSKCNVCLGSNTQMKVLKIDRDSNINIVFPYMNLSLLNPELQDEWKFYNSEIIKNNSDELNEAVYLRMLSYSDQINGLENFNILFAVKCPLMKTPNKEMIGTCGSWTYDFEENNLIVMIGEITAQHFGIEYIPDYIIKTFNREHNIKYIQIEENYNYKKLLESIEFFNKQHEKYLLEKSNYFAQIGLFEEAEDDSD